MSNQLPATLASRQRRAVIDDATSNLGASRGAHISIKGGRFRLISAIGVETLINEHHLDVIVIDANDKPSRVFFEGEYVPGNDDPPVCFSDNGTGPSNQSIAPQAPTCAVCPHNIRGSSTTFSGKASTACDNRKKVAVIIPDDPAVNVYEFQIPPGSLGNLKAYGQYIRQQGSGEGGRPLDIADFVTRVSFDPDKQFTLLFHPVAWADDERTIKLIEHIDANKLSDAAVGRNDVAADPEQVRLMLAGGQRPATIAAPASSPQQPQGPQFALPPRTNGALPAAAGTAPVATPPAPPAPRGRGRAPKAPPEAPAGASATAPFMSPAAAPQFAPPTPPAAAPRTAVSPSSGQIDTSIPDFLRRTPDATQPAPQAPSPPRFGVGQPPTPPAAIQDALQQAMNLPTRG